MCGALALKFSVTQAVKGSVHTEEPCIVLASLVLECAAHLEK